MGQNYRCSLIGSIMIICLVLVCATSSESKKSPKDEKHVNPMNLKQHGSCVGPIQQDLRWSCDRDIADHICCFNRHFAEHRGYWETTTFLTEESKDSGEIHFYDSVTGKELFVAPRGRTFQEFVLESKSHGWPSFRDEEINLENVIVLEDGETVSVDGTHLGHNIPDASGNRYCINIVSVAGNLYQGQ